MPPVVPGANLSSAPSPRTPAAGGSSPLDKEGSGISTTSSASRRPAIVPFKPSGGGGGGGAGASRAAQTPAAAEALKVSRSGLAPSVPVRLSMPSGIGDPQRHGQIPATPSQPGRNH